MLNATPQTVCKEAVDHDKRVDYNFCLTKLLQHHDSTEADTWGLAKIVALIGVGSTGDTVADIGTLINKPGTDEKTKAALGECRKLYNQTEYAFADAFDNLNRRNYAAGKEKVAEAVTLVQRCDNSFVKAGISLPLTRQSSESKQLVIIRTAISNLIK